MFRSDVMPDQADWYFSIDGEQAGPVTLDALRQMARSGNLVPGQLVWTQGMIDWTPAGSVPVLHPWPGAPQPSPVTLDYFVPAELELVFAGFWVRFAALMIDCVIFTLPLGLVIFAIEMSGFYVVPQQAEPFVALMGHAAFWLYFALMESSPYQATVGKQLMGIVVTNMEGQRIGFGRATGRFFAKYLSYWPLMIGFLVAAFSGKKQALHDLIAGTVVVTRGSAGLGQHSG